MDFWLEEKFATLYCSLDRREGTLSPSQSNIVNQQSMLCAFASE
jgi:hypothetical protein